MGHVNNNSNDQTITEKWYLNTLVKYSDDNPPEYPELPFGTIVKQIRDKISRKLKGRKKFEFDRYSSKPVNNALCMALIENLKIRRDKGVRTVAVLSPHPNDETLSAADGYMRRVAQIDKLLLKDEYRIYLYDSDYWNYGVPKITYFGYGEIYVVYNGGYLSHLQFIKELISLCSICYIQSIMRLLPKEGSLYDPSDYLLSSSETKYILDLHGTVPLEMELVGKDSRQAKITERKSVQVASAIVLVNKRSREYVTSICNSKNPELYVIPMINVSEEVDCEYKNGIKVIYAGGTQKWQLIDEILEAIRKCQIEGVQYELLLGSETSGEKFAQIPNVTLGSVPFFEVPRHLCESHYGFMLRNDSDINKYATPTKLIEYIQYKVIPILKSTHIGDFVDEGMQYVSIDDFIDGILPTEEKRNEMALHNLEVLRNMSINAEAEMRRLHDDFFV